MSNPQMKPYVPNSRGPAGALRRQAAMLREKASDLQAQLDHAVGVWGEAYKRLDAQQTVEERITKTSGRQRALGVRSPLGGNQGPRA